ncbi:MAG: hypothetical protein Q7T73_12935 [Beijerinckiaceae bacterium]|nr:hypothetical protein [Beijerinckiaceae bacterium]
MELMEPEEKTAFIWKLIRGTNEGKIPWADGRPLVGFATHIGRFRYEVKSRDNDDLFPYELTILQDKGGRFAVIDEWTTASSANLEESLEALYKAVARTVLGLDETKAAMLDDLNAAVGDDDESTFRF